MLDDLGGTPILRNYLHGEVTTYSRLVNPVFGGWTTTAAALLLIPWWFGSWFSRGCYGSHGCSGFTGKLVSQSQPQKLVICLNAALIQKMETDAICRLGKTRFKVLVHLLSNLVHLVLIGRWSINWILIHRQPDGLMISERTAEKTHQKTTVLPAAATGSNQEPTTALPTRHNNQQLLDLLLFLLFPSSARLHPAAQNITSCAFSNLAENTSYVAFVQDNCHGSWANFVGIMRFFSSADHSLVDQWWVHW